MEKTKVIIIGGGLGGLQCGVIMARHGYDVTVLEQEGVIGGCLQTFVRRRAVFDTGFHYVGGLDEGQSLHTLFRYFDLLDLPWVRMDKDCFDEIVIGDESFPFASGHDHFAERLTERFPHQKDNLRKYVTTLKEVGDRLFDALHPRSAQDFYSTSLFSHSAYDFLCETISDPLLRKVLSGASLKMELNAESLPLYVFAQINDSFIRSAWRLKGGGNQIADKLAATIRSCGGRVLTDSEVTRIKAVNGRVSGVEVNGGRFLEADWVISDIHPALTASLVDDGLRKVYRNRMAALENTCGMFTANILLKQDTLPYINRNFYIHSEEADLWHPAVPREGGQCDSVLVSFPPPYNDSAYAVSLDLLSPMSWAEVEKWSRMRYGHRGEDYVEFKNARTGACLDLVEKRLPALRDAIDRVFTSTPVTYNSYLKSPCGSAYGVRKDWRSPMTTVLTPKTPLENLLLAGQSLNLHGILGVSMTSVFTCAAILGMPVLAREILG